MTDNNLVLCNYFDGYCIVTLNRPEAMNALSSGLRQTLTKVVQDIGKRSDMRAVILTGAGERAFSAGLDLKEISGEPGDLRQALTGNIESDPVVAIRALNMPVIAAVNGHAITGGFELALACDILIASDNASFADTHARVGVVPGWGLSQILTRVIGPSRANEMHFSGRPITAQTASDWGLVSRVVSLEQLMPEAVALAQQISEFDPQIIAELKHVIRDGNQASLAEGLAIEMQASQGWAAKMNKVVSPLD
jgi:enoyl-CoA hydratase/carnithine racemase